MVTKTFKYSGGLFLVVSASCTLLGVLVVDKYRNMIASADRAVTIQNVSSLELLLNSYYNDNGKYPPTRYQRNPGEPYHSWRVLLLPYLSDEWEKSFSNYDFAEEWNSPNNIKVLGNVSPRVYTIQSDARETTQVYALGEHDEWPLRKEFMRAYIAKQNGDTFTIIEVENSNIHWAEPKF